MKLHQLKIFESVARHLNVTNAADELHMSQPAVSLQLKQLEQEYGLKFYESNNQGVKLTSRGLAFLDAIRPILAQIDEVDLAFKGRGRVKESDPLTVGSNHTLSLTVLPEILKNLKKYHPEVQLVLETSNSRTIENWIRDSKIEIGLINKPSYFANCIYQAYQEQEHETLAFVPADSPITSERMSLEELVRHFLIVREGSSCTQELKKRGFKLKLALQCHAPEAVKTAVQRGLGVGLLFRTWVDSEITKGDFRAIDVPELRNITFRSFIAYGAEKPLSPQAKAFLQTCLKSQPGKGVRVKEASDLTI